MTRHAQNARIARGLHQDVQRNVSETRARSEHSSNLRLNPTRNPFGCGQGQHLQAVLRKEGADVSGLCPIPMRKPSWNVILEDAVLEQALPPIRVAQMLALIR